ncbi:MAG: cofactor-independent phosphoglycerate mutase [Oscillospiraceae bacterium]|nr:cofactor-independent phosphoglycerate mutase [Oscillospiraceae bacterium]MDD4414159.1 cofactor-independent phosphoglycerate mutase [Oscillospiraceae bacterium]
MKYAVVLCDGMADTKSDILGGKTPMELAEKPIMDWLAANGEVGMVQTIPKGMSPGSDVANLTVMGYDAEKYYTGRSPFEAANIGIELGHDDLAFRCNLVTLSEDEEYSDKTMVDYCAGDIHTNQADKIIRDVQLAFGSGDFNFYTGTAYRHCMVWHGGKHIPGALTPPHDITGQIIGGHLPLQPEAAPLLDMMKKSVDVLKNHPVNIERKRAGLKPANAIWLWGQGKKPSLEQYNSLFSVDGAVISAVDLIKGMGRIAGMKVCEVEGATGYIDTNYQGKVSAAVNELKSGRDFVYIHLEAPDECGHRGEAENKVRAIEEIDSRILKPLINQLEKMGEFKIMVLPDHPTPLATRTHSDSPVPYLIYSSNIKTSSGVNKFTEETASKTGIHIKDGRNLIRQLLNE